MTMVTAHEPPVANVALVSLFPSVGANVPLQLVGARESLPTVRPATDERPLTSVPAQVPTEVRSLAIHLATPWEVADVPLLLDGASIDSHGAVGTGAGHSFDSLLLHG